MARARGRQLRRQSKAGENEVLVKTIIASLLPPSRTDLRDRLARLATKRRKFRTMESPPRGKARRALTTKRVVAPACMRFRKVSLAFRMASLAEGVGCMGAEFVIL